MLGAGPCALPSGSGGEGFISTSKFPCSEQSWRSWFETLIVQRDAAALCFLERCLSNLAWHFIPDTPGLCWPACLWFSWPWPAYGPSLPSPTVTLTELTCKPCFLLIPVRPVKRQCPPKLSCESRCLLRTDSAGPRITVSLSLLGFRLDIWLHFFSCPALGTLHTCLKQ